MVKYLVELVRFRRADFSLSPFESPAALLCNNLRGSQNFLTVGSKTSGESFPGERKKSSEKKSGAVEVRLMPQLLVRFTGASQSHSLPLGYSVDAHREKEWRRLRRSTCGSHLEEAERAQVRAAGPAVGATRTSSGGDREQHAAHSEQWVAWIFPRLVCACLFYAKLVFAKSTVPAGFFLL